MKLLLLIAFLCGFVAMVAPASAQALSGPCPVEAVRQAVVANGVFKSPSGRQLRERVTIFDVSGNDLCGV